MGDYTIFEKKERGGKERERGRGKVSSSASGRHPIFSTVDSFDRELPKHAKDVPRRAVSGAGDLSGICLLVT